MRPLIQSTNPSPQRPRPSGHFSRRGAAGSGSPPDRPRPQPYRPFPARQARSERPDLFSGSHQSRARYAAFISTSGDYPLRPNRPKLFSRTTGPTRGSGSSIRYWLRHIMENDGAATGSISPAMLTRKVSWTPTTSAPPPGDIATLSSARSTRTHPTTDSSRLQIAGDELIDYPGCLPYEKPTRSRGSRGIVATGYLQCASDTSRPDFENIKNTPGYYYQTLEDTVKIVASSTLGLTLQCAKCHSHKYDPITQEEYYRVQAIFMSGYRPAQWVPQVERGCSKSTAAQEADAKAHNTEIDSRVAKLVAKTRSLIATFAARLLTDRLGTASRADSSGHAAGARNRGRQADGGPEVPRGQVRGDPQTGRAQAFGGCSPRSIRNTSLSPRRSRRASPWRKPASTRLPRSAPFTTCRRREDSDSQARRLHAARPRSRPGRARRSPRRRRLRGRLKRRTPGPAVDGWRSRNGSPRPDIR